MAKKKFNFVLSRKPPKAAKQYAEVREQIRKRLNVVGESHVKSRSRIVGNWSGKTKPKFSYKVGVNVGRITLQVNVQEKQLPFWRFVDRGTRPHIIRARNAPYLAFRRGGVPKTGANPARFGAGRIANGAFVRKDFVNHPGTKARNFSKKINADLKEDELKAIKNGGRAGLRRANK